MQLKFQGQYDKDLFFKAVALANRPPKNRQRLLSVMMVIALGAIIVIGYRTITSRDWAGNLVYLGAAIFMGAYVAQFLLRPYFVARKLWTDPGTKRPLKGIISNQGITYIFPEGENMIEWKRFNRLQKTNNLVTLVREDGLLLIFPKYFFKNKSNWLKFNQLVNNQVTTLGEKGIQRPAK